MQKQIQLEGRGNYSLNLISDEIYFKNKVSVAAFVLLTVVIIYTVNLYLVMLFYQNQVPFLKIYGTIIFLMLICLILGFSILPYRMADYGLRFDKLKYNVIIGLTYGTAGMAIALTFRYIMVLNGNETMGFHPGLQLFDALSPVCAVLQEWITKGYLQTCLISVLGYSKPKKYAAITVSSLVFAQFHMIMGFQIFILAFIFSFILGIIYEKTRSIIGISIIHFFVGFSLFSFCGF